MKERIREFALKMGVDDVGFAAASDYNSPRSPKLESILPDAKSIIVLAYRELSSCESASMEVAMNGRLDVMEYSRSCNYKLARFLENECGAKAMTVSVSYPLQMSYETMGSIGEISLRHAAVAAGLGTFGRHNLVIHPKLGSRVIFTAVLTNLELPSDAPVGANPCTECNLCVENCPAGALSKEGYTDVGKCLKKSQPYGIGTTIRFWAEFGKKAPEERRQMVRDVEFWRLYQAGFLGFQYFCFNCQQVCEAAR